MKFTVEQWCRDICLAFMSQKLSAQLSRRDTRREKIVTLQRQMLAKTIFVYVQAGSQKASV